MKHCLTHHSLQRLPRRSALAVLASALAVVSTPAGALLADSTPLPANALDATQSGRFRAWMAFVIADQLRRGPSARWVQHDCASLVRFAVSEALREHDQRWRQANGYQGQALPLEVELRPEQRSLRSGWTTLDGQRNAYVNAMALVQQNCRFLGRDDSVARRGDLLFFDQGDEQHLMVWLGNWIAYHNGQPDPVINPVPKSPSGPGTGGATPSAANSGLRAITPADLIQWKDTRWRPLADNPNFAGYFRLAFLSR